MSNLPRLSTGPSRVLFPSTMLVTLPSGEVATVHKGDMLFITPDGVEVERCPASTPNSSVVPPGSAE